MTHEELINSPEYKKAEKEIKQFNTMKTNLKNLIYYALGAIIIIALIAITVHLLNTPKKTGISLHDKQLIDSVNRVNLELKNAEIDSIRLVLSLEAQKSHSEAETSSKQAQKYKSIADKQKRTLDSLKIINAPCGQQLTKCTELNGTYQNEIKELEVTCSALDVEARSYSNQLFLCDKQRDNDSMILHDYMVTSKMQDSVIFVRNQQIEKQVKKTKVAKVFGNIKSVIFTTLGIAGTIYIMK